MTDISGCSRGTPRSSMNKKGASPRATPFLPSAGECGCTLVTLQSAHVIADNVHQGPRIGLSTRQGSAAGQSLAAEVLVGTGTAKTSVGFKAPQWPELLTLDHC